LKHLLEEALVAFFATPGALLALLSPDQHFIESSFPDSNNVSNPS
jgi:hypothetical protein